MILTQHIPLLHEILTLPEFLTEPILSFGFHDVLWHKRLREYITRYRAQKEQLQIFLKMRQELAELCGDEMYSVDVPWQFMEWSVNDILTNYGKSDITTIDLFDGRADYQHDMNLPIPAHLENRFKTIIDVGSVEHIFDTRQCLDSLFRMLRVGGHIMFHLPCNGCFDHGFYTFSPEAIIESLRLNGFKIIFLAFSLEPEGMKLDNPVEWSDCILWCAARKMREEKQFVIPQQNGCKAMYGLAPLKGVLEEPVAG